MSDITERLRGFADKPNADAEVCLEAADEIERLRGIEQFVTEASRHERDGLRANNERLRAALRRFWPGPCPQCSGDCYSANPPVANCPMLQARDALEPKP